MPSTKEKKQANGNLVQHNIQEHDNLTLKEIDDSHLLATSGENDQIQMAITIFPESALFN